MRVGTCDVTQLFRLGLNHCFSGKTGDLGNSLVRVLTRCSRLYKFDTPANTASWSRRVAGVSREFDYVTWRASHGRRKTLVFNNRWVIV